LPADRVRDVIEVSKDAGSLVLTIKKFWLLIGLEIFEGSEVEVIPMTY